MLRLNSHVGLIPRLPSTLVRSLHFTSSRFQDQQQISNSLFGEVTEAKEQKSKNSRNMVDALDSPNATKKIEAKRINVKNDVELQKFIGHEPTPAAEKYLSPLKLEIYKANVAQNGFFKNNDVVKLANGEKYQLKLPRGQIEALEPSIYLKSFRIKHSLKKATRFLKLINRMNVKKALTQSHFNQKMISRDVAELLAKGLKEAEQLNLNPNELFLDQIWTGKDGGRIVKRLDFKGRGKIGVIEHPYVHVRAILKGEQTKKRLAYEQEQKALRRSPYMQLPSASLRWKPEGFYKW